MGFVTTGKPLSADHPFFATGEGDGLDNEEVLNVHSALQTQEQEEEDDDDYDGNDEDYYLQDYGRGGDMVYEENTFFDAPEFAEGGGEHVSMEQE